MQGTTIRIMSKTLLVALILMSGGGLLEHLCGHGHLLSSAAAAAHERHGEMASVTPMCPSEKPAVPGKEECPAHACCSLSTAYTMGVVPAVVVYPEVPAAVDVASVPDPVDVDAANRYRPDNDYCSSPPIHVLHSVFLI